MFWSCFTLRREKQADVFWTMNIILCIDFPALCVEFEVCVVKTCQCRDFLFAVVRSILTEQADKTPWKLLCDQKNLKMSMYEKGNLFRERGIERFVSSSAVLLWNICGMIILALGTWLPPENIDFIFLLTAGVSPDGAVSLM